MAGVSNIKWHNSRQYAIDGGQVERTRQGGTAGETQPQQEARLETSFTLKAQET